MGSSQYDLIYGDADVGAVCGGKVDIFLQTKLKHSLWQLNMAAVNENEDRSALPVAAHNYLPTNLIVFHLFQCAPAT